MEVKVVQDILKANGSVARSDRARFDAAGLLAVNLMCPSQYDLGEYHTVVVLSVAEGADKPEKYPAAFQRASAVVINKLDLLPFTDVDLATVTGEGVEPWQRWLEEKLAERLAR